MRRSALVNKKVWKELPGSAHQTAKEAMKLLQSHDEPGHAPNVKPLEGSAYPASYRLRVGRYRICFIHFPDGDTIVFTTAFLKRRPSDYLKAVKRHDQRVRDHE